MLCDATTQRPYGGLRGRLNITFAHCDRGNDVDLLLLAHLDHSKWRRSVLSLARLGLPMHEYLATTLMPDVSEPKRAILNKATGRPFANAGDRRDGAAVSVVVTK